METLEDDYGTLSERVDGLIRAAHRAEPLLMTTTRAETIQELIARTEGLERAVREIAREVEGLSAEHEHFAAVVR